MVIGILIITWNSADVIETCIAACSQVSGARVLVVDNASSDDTVAVVKRHATVELIASETNLGFSGGVNLGMRKLADCDAVLLLNPDAAPTGGVGRLAEAVLQPGVGAAGGTLNDPNGRRQEGFHVRAFPTPWTLAFEVLGINRLLPWNPVNRRYRMLASKEINQEVDQPAAAFLMVKHRAWEAVGGFDESFHPVWFEDVDFCWRLRKYGYRILYVPEATAVHIGGHSAAYLDWDSRQLFWYGSLLRYASRRFTSSGRAAVGFAVMAASIPRAVRSAAAQGIQRSVRVYSEVFRMAWVCWRHSERLVACTTTNRREREGQTASSPGK